MTMNFKQNHEAAIWAHTHFENAFATDVRRKNRIIKVAEMMARLPGKSIPQLVRSAYDVKATYQLFKHHESTPMKLQRGHREIVLEKINKEPGLYLLVEDTSDIIFKGRNEIEGLGQIGNGKVGLKGFLLHTILAVKYPSNLSKDKHSKRSPVEVVGIADQQYHVRKQIKKPRKSRQFENRERESDLWLHSRENIGSCPANMGLRWVRVADRGADIYEYMVDSLNNNYEFVVRASHDRVLISKKKNQETLFSHARMLPKVGKYELELRARPLQSARTITLSLSYGKVSLRAPQRPGVAAGALKPIDCTIVYVKENGVKSKTPLEWFILTNINISCFEEAYEIVEWYTSRWIVEDYHKALKSGMKIEELQLDTQQSLFAAISLMAVAALRLVNLREIIRLKSEANSSESGLDDLERMTLEKYTDSKLTTVEEVGKALGCLGGHMGRKNDGAPGMITLWRGYTRLRDMVEGVKLVLK